MARGNKKRLLEALKKSLGIVTTAAKKTGIDRKNHYKWLKEDPEYKKQVEEIEKLVPDFVISKLFENINKGDMAAIRSWLKYKGHKHGWIEKRHLKVEGDLNQNILTAKDFSEAWKKSKKSKKQ